MMKKRNIIIAAVAVVVIIIVWIAVGNSKARKSNLSNIYAEAAKGKFDIIVTTTGELEAEHSVEILGPSAGQSRGIRLANIEITDLVPEGTEVKAGEYVATLDRTSFDNTLKDELEKLDEYETNLEVAMLDSAVTLSNLRDNLINLEFSVEEAKITLEQSTYEPPSTIRQAEIAVDKAIRELDQAKKSYALSVEQEKRDMRTVQTRLSEQKQLVSDLRHMLSQFYVVAPSDGMIIYKKDRDGSKRKIGSTINNWDNVVATLPDMTRMISKTYVNEIDISKVKSGQPVEIEVDAFPGKHYTGIVTDVANIGEQLPNADAKVFEVLIKVRETDLILRPSMTTGNKIYTNTLEDVTYVPLEAVHITADSISFIYMKNGTKRIVLLGENNENMVVIQKGINAGEVFYLNTPGNADKFNKVVGEELIPAIKKQNKEKESITNKKDRPKRGGRMDPAMIEKFKNMTQEQRDSMRKAMMGAGRGGYGKHVN